MDRFGQGRDGSVWLEQPNMPVAAVSDWIVDVALGAGEEGGRIVVSGRPNEVASQRTAKHLTGAL